MSLPASMLPLLAAIFILINEREGEATKEGQHKDKGLIYSLAV